MRVHLTRSTTSANGAGDRADHGAQAKGRQGEDASFTRAVPDVIAAGIGNNSSRNRFRPDLLRRNG